MNFDEQNSRQKHESNRAFDLSAETHGDSFKAVMHTSTASQAVRFEELLKHLSLTDSELTLADVGCGNCGLYQSIQRQGLAVKYTGIDINSKLLDMAESSSPGIDLIKADITAPAFSLEFDYVVMSTLFNLDVGQNQEWCEAFISCMYKMSRKAIAFNAVSTHVNFTEKGMFYLNPVGILAFALENLSHHIVLDHGIPPYNYTVTIFKKEE